MSDESGVPERSAGGDEPDRSTDRDTDSEVIALFPLGFVLMPGAALPIHVFERRYRDLLADVSEPGAPQSFGVVALTRGTETGRDVDVADVGTLAEIVERQPYPDGTVDLLTMGSRRFRVIEVDHTSRSYLRARIVWLPEDEGDLPAELILGARALCRVYCEELAAITGRPAGEAPSRDPLKLSYEIALRLHLENADRQLLLAAATVADRLRAGVALLLRETALVTRTRTVPVTPKALLLVPTHN